MDNKEAVEALKIHKRWINGKGKKISMSFGLSQDIWDDTYTYSILL